MKTDSIFRESEKTYRFGMTVKKVKDFFDVMFEKSESFSDVKFRYEFERSYVDNDGSKKFCKMGEGLTLYLGHTNDPRIVIGCGNMLKLSFQRVSDQDFVNMVLAFQHERRHEWQVGKALKGDEKGLMLACEDVTIHKNRDLYEKHYHRCSMEIDAERNGILETDLLFLDSFPQYDIEPVLLEVVNAKARGRYWIPKTDYHDLDEVYQAFDIAKKDASCEVWNYDNSVREHDTLRILHKCAIATKPYHAVYDAVLDDMIHGCPGQLFRKAAWIGNYLDPTMAEGYPVIRNLEFSHEFPNIKESMLGEMKDDMLYEVGLINKRDKNGRHTITDICPLTNTDRLLQEVESLEENSYQEGCIYG